MLSKLCFILFQCAGVLGTILYAGVNESGGEFGVYPGGGLPGEFGVDYQFINTSTIDIYVDQNKINVFRVCFLLERMCPLEYGLGSKFNETHFNFYKDAIDYITVTKGAYALIDPHNYMRYGDPSNQPVSGSVIGSKSDPSSPSTADFQAFWNELAGRFKSNPNVIFGIMNEPHDMPTTLVLKNDQAAINGIRAAGAKQLILAPGNGYTGGEDWLIRTGNGDAPSADYLYKLKDPLQNTAMDVHQYLDPYFSGTSTICAHPGQVSLAGLTSWLKKHKLKAFVSEFGGSNNTMCAQDLRQMLRYLANNPEYIGWSMWAAGPLWGSYAPCCNNGTELLGSLEPNVPAGGGSPSLYDTVWLKVIQKLVPTTLKKSGMSGLDG